MNVKLPKELVDKFKSLGLSPNEIKVYLLLISQGPLTAKEISDYALVPFSKIYMILNSLEKKGWITSSVGRPIRYSARAPQEAVEIVRRNLEKSMSEAAEYIAKELGPLYEKMSVSVQPNILLFYGEPNISMKIVDVILNTRKELLLAIHHRLDTLFEYSSKLADTSTVLRNRPRIRVLVSRNLVREVMPLTRLGAEVRYREEMYGGGAIADDREAIIILDKDEIYSTAIWSTHYSLIELAKAYFDKLWSASKVVA